MAVTDFSLAHTPGGSEVFGGVMIPDPASSSGDTLQSTGVAGAPAEWAPGGGSLPVVGCALVVSTALDVQDSGSFDFKPDQLFDNIYAQNQLMALPDGIGFTVAIDGSSGVVTFTEAGTWSFLFTATLNGADDTYVGNLGIPYIQVTAPLLAGRQCTFPITLSLPAGASFSFQITTTADATSDPYDAVGLYLIVDRLG